MSDKKVKISVKKLSAGYERYHVLENVSFDVYEGQIVTLLGGSGCGKSTLLKHIIGLHKPLSGDVLIDGESIVNSDYDKRLEIMRKFGVAYQGGALFRAMTLEENVALPLQEFTTLTKKEIHDRVMEKLSLVNLEKYATFMPSDLSGGMIKRCAFARAMALDPKILFFDEPSAGLDPISSESLDSLIISIRNRTGATIVMVTHELPSIFSVSDRVIMLSRTKKGIIADGAPKDLRDNSPDEYVRAFLGRRHLEKK